MFYSPLKKLSLIIVLWFASLQVIAPFMHSHSGDEHFVETVDLHIHVDDHSHDKGNNATQHNGSYLVSDGSTTSMHTFIVADGLANDTDNSLTVYATLIFLFCFLVRGNVLKITYPSLYFLHDNSLNRRRPSPRAPPSL